MRRWLYALIPAVCIGVDQLVKYWARIDLSTQPGGTIPLIQDVFHLTYAENRGAAFSILQDQRWLFLVLTSVVCLAIIYILFIRKPTLEKMPGIPLAFFLGGAIGNVIDRAVRGYVVDMFDFRLISFAVFNVADACLVCAVIALGIWMLWTEARKKKEPEHAALPQDGDK